MDTSRISGMVSGMDTEAMIKSMVAVHQSKVDSVKQDKQYALWQQETYREVISDLNSFKSQFLDVAYTDKCFLMEGTFNSYKATSSSTVVSVVATGDNTSKTHTISNITIAQKDIWQGNNIASMIGSGINIGAINAGDKINVKIDGNIKTITLNGGYADIDALVTDLQTRINTEFGAGKVTVGKSGGELSFVSSGHVFQISNANSGDTVISSMGFTSGDTNVLNTSKSLGDANFTNDIFGAESTLSFSINGETFTFDKSSDTVQDLIDEVNNNINANVTLCYSQISNTFTLESDEEGEINQITFQDITGSFFSNGLGINHATNTGHTQTGSDASFTLDGVTTSRSSNLFTIDGIQYTLNESTTSSIDISVGTDITDVKDTIVKFVDEYNKMIEELNDLVKEEKYYDFKPLTDEQKEEMSDEEIEKWEEKAKSGILRGDDIIEKTIRDFRNALIEKESDLGISLYDLGITTSTNYMNGGQLVIDEDKLDEVLSTRADDVAQLFTDKDKGIGTKMEAVMDYAIKPIGETKGMLLQKAGLKGTATEAENVLSKAIKDYDERIDELLEDLNRAEDAYYAKFAAMEVALQRMNSQSSWLAGQLGQ